MVENIERLKDVLGILDVGWVLNDISERMACRDYYPYALGYLEARVEGAYVKLEEIIKNMEEDE